MLDITPSATTPRFAFGAHDALHIDGIAYRAVERTENGWVVVRRDGTGVAESYTDTQLAQLARTGQLVQEREALRPDGARQKLAAPADLLSTLSTAQHAEIRCREAAVLGFLDCEREDLVKRTDPSIEAALEKIEGRAGKYLKQPSACQTEFVAPGQRVVPELTTRTLRRWVKAYENLGLAGLCGSKGNRGNRERRLHPDAQSLMYTVVDGYADDLRPSQAEIYEDVKVRFEEENASRKAAGKTSLRVPSREAVRQAIRALDPFRTALARDGVGVVARRDGPVGRGLELTRPLERVEMDACTIDLMSLMALAGLNGMLSDADKAILGLDGGKARWHLTLAQCATTRCILGMRLSRSANAQTTLQTLDMMLRDKGVWTDAVTTLAPWNQFGTPELIVTDCGTEFMNYDVRVALRDLGIRFENAPAGAPRLRGRVERLFRTVGTRLTGRLTGRTFSNMIEKGDYDPKAKAALTADDLCHALIRWVVDIYHNTSHAGLDGETPARCWTRLVDSWGVGAPPDLRRRRLALGTHLTRTVQKTGITVWGVRYQSETLARWRLHSRNRAVDIRWYAEDIGAIAVRLGDGWVEVPAVFASFDGVRAQTWLAAARQLRAQARHDATFDEETILDAIRCIDRINGHAMRRIGLLAGDWSQTRVDAEEDRLFVGFKSAAPRREAPPAAGDTRFGEEIAAPGPAGADAGTQEPIVPAPGATMTETAEPAPDAAPAGTSDNGSAWEIEDDI